MLYHPIEDVTGAIHAALIRDLPSKIVREQDWDAWKKFSPEEKAARNRRKKAGDRTAIPMKTSKKRPKMGEISVEMFPQNWPTSALGFSWKGDPGETPAYTIIVSFDGAHAVYFGSRLAYLVLEYQGQGTMSRRDPEWLNFKADVKGRNMSDCFTATARYRAVRYSSELPEEVEA
jgi:hypothetical protein